MKGFSFFFLLPFLVPHAGYYGVRQGNSKCDMFLAKRLCSHACLEALRSDGAYHIVCETPHDWLSWETQYKPVIYNGMRERSPTGTVLTFTSIKARCEANKKEKEEQRKHKAAHARCCFQRGYFGLQRCNVRGDGKNTIKDARLR